MFSTLALMSCIMTSNQLFLGCPRDLILWTDIIKHFDKFLGRQKNRLNDALVYQRLEFRWCRPAIADHTSDFRHFAQATLIRLRISWSMPLDASYTMDPRYLNFSDVTACSGPTSIVLESGLPHAISVFDTFSLSPPFSNVLFQRFTLRSSVSRSAYITNHGGWSRMWTKTTLNKNGLRAGPWWTPTVI